MTITPLFISGCNFHNETGQRGPKPFPAVSVPAMLSGQDAAEYAAEHFWNRYFDSTASWAGISDTLIGGVRQEDMTAAVREYLLALWSIPYDRAFKAQTHLITLAETSLERDTSGHIYDWFTATMESALWNPLSELRNEGLYIPVIESILAPAPLPPTSHLPMPRAVRTASTARRANIPSCSSPTRAVRPAAGLSPC